MRRGHSRAKIDLGNKCGLIEPNTLAVRGEKAGHLQFAAAVTEFSCCSIFFFLRVCARTRRRVAVAAAAAASRLTAAAVTSSSARSTRGNRKERKTRAR